jgi:hypothetical protein
VVILRRSGQQFWAAVRNDPAVGPYYVLMKPWSVVSMNQLWLRLPSAVAMAVATGLLMVLARRVLGRRVAIACVGAMLLMPAVTRYGQDARPYALALLGATAAVFSWWTFMESGKRRWGVGLWLALIFTGLMHAYALLVVGALIAVALALPLRDRSADVKKTVLAVAAAVAALAPYLVYLRQGAIGQPDPPTVTARNVAEEVARLPVSVLQPPLAVAASAAFLGLCAVGLIWSLARLSKHPQSLTLLAAVWLLLPPAALVVLQGLTGKPGLVARYWTFCLPALAVGIGLALSYRRARWTAWLGIGMLFALALPTQLAIRAENGHLGERWARLPRVLEQTEFSETPLLIQGFSQRGLSANAPDLPASRTPLNGNPGPSGLISPVPYGPGTPQFTELTQNNDTVFIYQQRRGGSSSIPRARDFTQTADARAVFSQPVALCQYYGDALGLFAKSESGAGSDRSTTAAAQIESVEPTQIDCAPAKRG